MKCVRKLLRFGYLLVCVYVLSGCAFSYVDNQGRHNVIGILNLSMQGVEDDKRKAGDKVEITNIGILFSHGPIHSGLSVGYNKESTMTLKNDALVLIEEDNVKDDEKNENENENE